MIEEMIQDRHRGEHLVHRISSAQLPTKYGQFEVHAFGVRQDTQQPIVFTMGDPKSVEASLVRIHSSCFTGDVLTSLRCDCGDQLQLALRMISIEGAGAVVYLPQEGRGIGLIEKIKAYNLQDQGLDTVEANLALGHDADSREYGIGIQILKVLGMSRVRLMTNNPKKVAAFFDNDAGLEVVEQVHIVPPANEHNADYLATKRDRMGHVLPHFNTPGEND